MEKIKKDKRPTVLISIACYEQKVYWQTLISMFHLANKASALPFKMELDIRANTFITHARNKAALDVLQGDYEAVLFIDSDMSFSALEVLTLYHWMQRGFRVCGANYTFKFMHWPLIHTAVLNGATPDELPNYSGIMNSELLPEDEQKHPIVKEVNYLGMGMTFIHKSVLQAIVEKYPEGWHETGKEKEYTFFDIGDTKLGYFGTEDAYFCKIAKEAGFKSYWPSTVRPGHTGVITFYPARTNEEILAGLEDLIERNKSKEPPK